VEEEKAWINEHLQRAQTARPLLDLPQQLANITSLSNVVASHKTRLQRVVELGRNLLRPSRADLPPSGVTKTWFPVKLTHRTQRTQRSQKKKILK